MWYVWFIVLFFGHLGISLLLAWRSRVHTSFCTVPKPEAFDDARRFSKFAQSQRESLKPSDFMVFSTTTVNKWVIQRWAAVYFFAGLVILVGVLIAHLIRPGLI
jgi:hypothetical protein